METEDQRAGRETHLEWLRSQRTAYDAHKAQCDAGVSSSDFAVGSESFEGESETVYRSLSMGPQQVVEIEYEEEPIYRSIDLSKMAVSSMPSPDPDASWVAGKRPPLLRRQNAFAFESQDPAWLGMLAPASQESGR